MNNKISPKFIYYELNEQGFIPYTYIYNNMVTQPNEFAYFKITDDPFNGDHCILEGYFLQDFKFVNPIYMVFKNKEEALQHVRNFGVEWE